jgi:ElaB/YqjD/DUF883 family membrane-anchored ribosome-binding protein
MSTSDTDAGRSMEQERRNAELRDFDDREPETIERELDATRADMRETLEALERRFSFDRLVDLTIGRVRERGGEFAGNLTNAATQNPLPLLLTTIGLSWMMLTSRRGARDYDSASYSAASDRERMAGLRERAAGAADTIHGAVDSTRDTLRHAADSSRDALRGATESLRGAAESSRETFEQTAASLRSGASRAAELTREQADYARERMDRLLHEQPLMLGALGLAAGAIIGALLPSTEHEDRLLGEARRKAVKAVAEKSRARFESARENAAAYSAPAGARVQEEEDSSERPASRPH